MPKQKLLKGFKNICRSHSMLKNVLQGMSVRERLLFMIRYAHAHKKALDRKKQGR